ncbi:MAG: hypothetical protein J0L78_11095 [Planctomycetes bacterium]|nr:hypothetical protein [Planctomycetota bacterium]
MSIPWTDWQFWVATVIALLALWLVLRNLLPPGWIPFTKPKGKQTKASITIRGKPVDRE